MLCNKLLQNLVAKEKSHFFLLRFCGLLCGSIQVFPGLTHVAAFSWWVSWGPNQAGPACPLSPWGLSSSRRQDWASSRAISGQHSNRAIPKWTSTYQIFFTYVPLAKASQVAKPRVSVRGDDIRAWIQGMWFISVATFHILPFQMREIGRSRR